MESVSEACVVHRGLLEGICHMLLAYTQASFISCLGEVSHIETFRVEFFHAKLLHDKLLHVDQIAVTGLAGVAASCHLCW